MKRIIALLLIAAAIFTFVGCSALKDGKKDDGKNTTGNKVMDDKSMYPRVTYYDKIDGMNWAAAVQNSHLIYTYGENWGDDEGTVPYSYEFLNCANYHYHRGYTLVGYEDARRGSLAEPDDHRAIVFEDGKGVLYDFYRKMIVDDYPYWEHDEDRAFLPICPDSELFEVYRVTLDFEKESKTLETGEIICQRIEKSVSTNLCQFPKGYQLKTKEISRGKSEHICEYVNYDFIYDTETECPLHTEIYVVNFPKAVIDESTGEIYNVTTSSLARTLNMTTYELNRVKPDDVKNKIAEVMSGHEAEYKHVSFSEYNEIFE